MWVCFCCLNIRFQSGNDTLQLTDLLRVIFQQVILHPKLLALMVSFQHLQAGDFDIQIHLFLDSRIAGTQSLDFCKGQGCFIHIFAGANRGFGGHNLADKFLLVFHRLPEVGVERPFCDITVDMNLLVHIALADNTTAPLFQITRSPGAVEIMQGNQPVLHIHTSAHFEGTAHQDTHLTGANLCKQLLFPGLGVCVMDERNLLCRNTTGNQLGTNVIIGGKRRIGGVECCKYTSIKGKAQQRFVRLNSLGEGYAEEDIRAVIAGEKKHRAGIKSPFTKDNRAFNLLVIIDDKIRAKGSGYQQWATNYNLKQMAKTRIFLKEHNINSMDELREKASTTSADFDRIDKELKSAEQRLVEIAALKKHIINYAKTRDVYVQYRKAGYSKAFFEAHREEITLHKAAKDAFQKMGVSKLPKVKELSEEYATVLEQKKSLYAQYRLSREEMREYQKALHNTEVFFDMDRNSEKDARTQSEVDQKNQPAK